MTSNDSLERHVSEGLAALASTRAPDYLDDVLRRSGRTRQRHAWLPLERSVVPVRAPHERAGSTHWRFLHMTPMLRYAAVATIALALGVGLAPIIGSPGPNQAADPSPSMSPRPSPDPAMAPAWVTGTLKLAPSCTGPTTTSSGGVWRNRDTRCEGQVVTMSDPRLSGTSVAEWNQDTHHTAVADGGAFFVQVGTYDLRNEGGSWFCRYTALTQGVESLGPEAETSTCVGSGSYAGLSAMLVMDWTTLPVTITGAIFPGEFPPAP